MVSRRGIVLGVVLLLLLFLLAIIFAYHRIVRSQNREAIRFSESELTARFAIEGTEWLGNALQQPGIVAGTTLRDSTLPQLFSESLPEEIVLATGTCRLGGTPSNPQYWLDQVAADYQKCLDQISRGFEDRLSLYGGANQTHPQCQGLGLRLRKISRLHPSPPGSQHLESGWDRIESCGELVLSCQIYFLGVSRIAVATRQFKLVSFLPGPYSRFTLFVHHAPHSHCYNLVRNQYDGSADMRGGGPVFRPLVLYHSPAPVTGANSSSILNAQDELHRKGWVFLGQTPNGIWNRDPSNLQGFVTLRIPSGYLPNPGAAQAEDLPVGTEGFGGHAYLCPPTLLGNSKVGVLPYPVVSTGLYQPNTTNGPWQIHLRFQGYYTHDPTNPNPADKGAAELGFWNTFAGPLRQEDCTTSWVLPCGDRRHLSRTLFFGALFADFLQYYTFSGPGKAGVILPPPPEGSYNPDTPLLTKPAFSGTPSPRLLFAGRADDPPGKPGLKAWQSLAPRQLSPQAGTQAYAGLAANLLFDLMSYQQLPDFSSSRSKEAWGIGQLSALSFWIPGNNQVGQLNTMDTVSPAFHPCIQPLTNVHLWRAHDPPAQTPPATVHTIFLGNLQRVHFRNLPHRQPPFDDGLSASLLSRVTHVIDLRGKTSPQSREILGSQVFTSVPSITGTPEWHTETPGIFFLQRLPQDPDLELPLPIRLKRPVILIVEHGSMVVAQEITDPSAAGPSQREKAPLVPCSLIALDGHIYLPPGREIHAYLAALNPSLTQSSQQGGRLLSSQAGPAGTPRRLIIKGGAALIELAPTGLGRSTIEDFSAGGVIRYNPLFNPSLPSVWDSYQLISAQRSATVTVSGGAD